MAMLTLLERMELDVTVHGFPSSFHDSAAELTGFRHDVCEMALAHTIANAAEAAYRRGDLFEKRRKLMGAWADFVCVPTVLKLYRLKPQHSHAATADHYPGHEPAAPRAGLQCIVGGETQPNQAFSKSRRNRALRGCGQQSNAPRRLCGDRCCDGEAAGSAGSSCEAALW